MNWARKCVKSSSLLPRRLARRAAAAAVDDAYDPQFSSPEDVARCLKLDDFQTFAERRLPRPLCVQISEKETPREGTPENACLARALRYEYLASGTGDEQTLRENRDAWGRIFLRPRVLRDVARVETRTELFGQPLSMPVFISPAGVHKLVDARGESASARAADRAGTLFGLSQHATSSIEEVAQGAPDASRWFQSYILRDRALTLALVDRALDSGYAGFFLTVDSVRFGFREADARNGFSALPPPLALANYPTAAAWDDRAHAAWDQNTEALFDAAVSWDDVAWLKARLRGRPLVVKGVMTGEDAAAALLAGADGVMVSNHGGRQLESSVATIDVLPEVREAVGPDVEVILDGGVRRGLDIVKGLARGADSVACGRAYLYGLAAGGFEGGDKSLSLLTRDVSLAMGLVGCRTVKELKEKGPDILLVRESSALRQGGIFDRKKAGYTLQPDLQ